MRRLAVVVLVMICCLSFSISAAEDVVETLAYGKVNWTKGIVTATGIGYGEDAEGAAKGEALRNLLAAVNGVHVDSDMTIQNRMTSSDIIKLNVVGIVYKPKLIDIQKNEDNSVKVTLLVKLEDLRNVINISSVEISDPTTLFLPTPSYPLVPSNFDDNSSGRSIIETDIEDTKARMSDEVYTGLIVDATGLNVRPGMNVKILNENGKEIYGSANVDQKYIEKQGMLGYAKTLDDAKKNDRVGKNPLVIRATDVAGDNVSVILKNDVADKVLKLADSLKFFTNANVMFVVN